MLLACESARRTEYLRTVFVRFSLVKYSAIGCAQISSICKAGLTVMGVL